MNFSTTAMTQSGKLAQEIYEEFLVCKICLETYKNPKCLGCLHTFCEQCIDSHVIAESSYKKYSDYREFTCPLCRKRTSLPVGGVKKLPDNFLVSSLNEVVGRQKPSQYPFCDICKLVSKRHREAQSKCLDCNKLLCKQCVEMHRDTKVTKNHSLFDVETEKDIECKEHKDEVVRFYCEICQTCICVLCTFNEHKDHDVTNFQDAVLKYKDNMKQMLVDSREKLALFESQLNAIGHTENVIKKAEQKIRDVCIGFISEIRSREKSLIEELHNIYGNETIDFIQRKQDLFAQLDGLKSTCSLTELVLNGKDMELLLLKKEVQEKLSVLREIDVSPLPPQVAKVVEFKPGILDIGYLLDQDRPMISKLCRRRFDSNTGTFRSVSQSDEDNNNTRTTQTQTEFNEFYIDSETGMSDGECEHRRSLVESGTSTVENEDKSGTSLEDEHDADEGDEENATESSAAGEDDEDEERDEEFHEAENDNNDDEVFNGNFSADVVLSATLVAPNSHQPETRDQEVMTDTLHTEEKGVNTRYRASRQESENQAADDDTEAARQARRRRRRERARAAASEDHPDHDRRQSMEEY